jgi:hypothetical protein
MIYRPYTPGEDLTVRFYNDDSVLVLTKLVTTNKLHRINLSVSGIAVCEVVSTNAPHFVIVYEA